MVFSQEIGHRPHHPGGDCQMKTQAAKCPARRRGFTLIEMIVYMVIFTIVVGCAP